jgi:hypothetical protein
MKGFSLEHVIIITTVLPKKIIDRIIQYMIVETQKLDLDGMKSGTQAKETPGFSERERNFIKLKWPRIQRNLDPCANARYPASRRPHGCVGTELGFSLTHSRFPAAAPTTHRAQGVYR